ncbi:MAG: creatininase family protein [Conexibacter sp.]
MSIYAPTTETDRELFFSNLTYPDVEALLADARVPVLLLPVGAIEPHGPHAPLGTDQLISDGMCLRAARLLAGDPKLRALILPPLPYGVTRAASDFAGAVGVGEQALEGFIAGILGSLIAQGFRHIAIVNNHLEPDNVMTLHRAADAVEREHGVVVGFLDVAGRRDELTDEFRRGESHAGCYETSLVLADRPELVDRARAAELPWVPVNLGASLRAGMRTFVEMGLPQAYAGTPATATPEEGAATFDRLAGMLVATMRELVAGTGGRDRPAGGAPGS